MTVKATAGEVLPCRVLFIMLQKAVRTFETVDEILKCGHEMKATEQYFPVVLFIMLYNVVLTFESING